MEFIFNLLAQFGGGRGGVENDLVRFGLGATFFGILLVVAWKRRFIERERLLTYGFGFGFGRELFMFLVTCGIVSGAITFDKIHPFFPPLEHSLTLASIVVVVGAYLGYVSGNTKMSIRYITFGLLLALACYVLTAVAWANFLASHPNFKFGKFWGDWLFHISGVLIIGYGILKLSKIEDWRSSGVMLAFVMFFIDDLLMLVNLWYGESYASYINPVRHNLHLLAIPLLGYIYVREVQEEKLNLIEEIKDKSKIIQAVNDLGREITSSLKINEVFESFARDLRDIINYDRMSIALVEAGEIKIIASVQNGDAKFSENVIKSGKSALKLAVSTGNPIIKENIDTVEYFEDEFLRDRGFKSYVFYPLKSKGKVVGSFNLFSKKEGAFSYQEMEIIECLSKYIAIALENLSLYRQIKFAYEELKEIEETGKNIISNVSHELLTPVTIVKGVLEILKDKCRNPGDLQLIEKSLLALNRQHNVIKDIVEYAKVTREVTLEISRVHIKDLVEEVLSHLMPKIRAKKIRVVKEIEDLEVFADGQKIRHVIYNLIDNAVKFNINGGIIRIYCKRKGNNAVFCISDTGVGIPETEHSKIFEPFYQIDSSPSRLYSGTGMGLAVVKRFVEIHGGRVWVDSKPGEGSSFYFTIPNLSNYGDMTQRS